MKNQISISNCFDYEIPLNEQIKYVAEAGFSHISFGSNTEHTKLFDEDRINEIKHLLNEYKLSVDTIHFSHPLSTDNWQPIMIKTMQVANELNCAVIVVHCSSFMAKEIDEKAIEKLKESVAELTVLCRQYRVKIALENLCPGKSTDVLEQVLNSTSSDYIGFCYDSSHDQIDGPRPFALLDKWKERLYAVHISDRIKPFTDHVTIGEGFIHFNEMAEILRTVNPDFPLLIEVMKTHSKYKDTKEFLDKAYSGASDLLSKIKSE